MDKAEKLLHNAVSDLAKCEKVTILDVLSIIKYNGDLAEIEGRQTSEEEKDQLSIEPATCSALSPA